MCYNCGCAIPDYDMGNPDNITNATFEMLARDLGEETLSVKKKMLSELQSGRLQTPEFVSILEKAAKAWGQTTQEAQKQTLKLLERRIK